MQRIRWALVLPLLGLAAWAAPRGGAATDPDRAALQAAETITPEEVREHIAFLASDALRGRETPSPGLDSAAVYLARTFDAMGLEPAGDAGFIQRFPFPVRGLDEAAVRLRLVAGTARRTLAYGTDYFAAAGAPGAADGSLVFTGRTVPEDPEDRGEATLTGRIALVDLPGRPGRNWQRAVDEARAAARAAGAAGVVFVLDPAVDEAMVRRIAGFMAEPRRTVGALEEPPAAFVREAALRAVLESAGRDLDVLRAADGAVPLPDVTVRLRAPAEVVEDDHAPNVAAMLPGSDPALRDTYVVFSAHMDHLGVGRPDASGDSIYNGADDNASGTTALLEVAEAFASLPQPPARTLVFLAVSGEEKGLLGSRWFTDHPTIPLERTVANINVDMIGRNAPDSIVVIGQEYSSLGPLVRQVAADHPELGLTVARDLWPEQRFFFRSDHFNFARKDIPALFFFAGVHEDYHKPSDEPDGIDVDKTTRVARLIFHTAHAIATAPEAPQWTEDGLAEVRAMTRGR